MKKQYHIGVDLTKQNQNLLSLLCYAQDKKKTEVIRDLIDNHIGQNLSAIEFAVFYRVLKEWKEVIYQHPMKKNFDKLYYDFTRDLRAYLYNKKITVDSIDNITKKLDKWREDHEKSVNK